MFYVIELLNVDDLNRIGDYAALACFVDGKETAGPSAIQNKTNEQIKNFDKSDSAALIKKRLSENAKFKMAAIPLRLSPLMLSRYRKGMAYGLHTDNAIMHPNSLRSDLAFTVFLSDPTTYEGGALSLRTGDVERNFKLSRGSMLLYPAGLLHQVMPVTSGIRIAVVGWVQSLIPDNQRREIVHDLSLVQSLGRREDSIQQTENLLALAKSNLLRLWGKN